MLLREEEKKRREEEEKKSLEALDSEAPEKGLNLYLNYILE